MNTYITVMAGGLGKRMGSTIPKVLHLINDKPMLLMIIEQVRCFNPTKILIIVGQYRNIIEETLLKYTTLEDVEFVNQPIALGTGNAVFCTLDYLKPNSINLILNGDTPLLQYTTLKNIYDNFIQNKYNLQITAINLDDPYGNGRIIKDTNDVFLKIVEEKDCNENERKINLVNCGIYIANTDVLKQFIPLITNNNSQNEYYLTDLVELYKKNPENIIGLYELSNDKALEIYNVNTKEQLDQLVNLIK